MAGFIEDNVINDILSRVNIVEVISEYIPLKRAGRNFKTNCPFHHEKTPSFMVSADKQIYHCFGCGAGGNVFNFLMQYSHLEFPEAVGLLAAKTGIVLPEKRKFDSKKSGFISELYKINDLAALFYSNNLHSSDGRQARDYLVKRGITQETAKLFQLGFASDKWDALIRHLGDKSINLSLMEKAGLIIPKEGGGFYDRFRNRIIFPILDMKSSVVGFGARVTDQTLPKYINSCETPIYIKGRHLYGINLAKDAVREADFIVIVEGYLDCITVYQQGMKNIVASLGTALTQEQARLIKRYTHNVVMVYDGDAAGQMATLRSLDIFIEEEMNVKVVALPEGFDPDLFVRKNKIDALKSLIEKADNLFDYKLAITRKKHNVKDPLGKSRIVSEILPMIKKFKNKILISEYIKKLSSEINVGEQSLYDELNKIKEERPYSYENVSIRNEKTGIHPTEKLLIKLMLEETELISQIKDRLDPADFQDERTAKVVSVMYDLIARGKDPKSNTLINYFGDDTISKMICESTFLPEVSSQDIEKIVDDCIDRLKKKSSLIKRQKLQEEIKNAETSGDELSLNRLKHEFNLLIKKG
jgi:DNA primase